jgi:hypothetical protein
MFSHFTVDFSFLKGINREKMYRIVFWSFWQPWDEREDTGGINGHVWLLGSSKDTCYQRSKVNNKRKINVVVFLVYVRWMIVCCCLFWFMVYGVNFGGFWFMVYGCLLFFFGFNSSMFLIKKHIFTKTIYFWSKQHGFNSSMFLLLKLFFFVEIGINTLRFRV